MDGERKLVQLGSPSRLELIYDTNLATAYSEGQWERIQRNKELFPFLEYIRSASVNPRDTHLAYAGLVLPVDDPFWASHLPIKEYQCKCTVVQHTQRMLDREGLTVGKAPPEVMRTVVNKRTGEVMQVPTGVHPAFHYPPGGRRAHLEKMLADKQASATGASTMAKASQAAVDAAKGMQGVAGKKVVHDLGPVTQKAVDQVKSATTFDLAGYTAMFDNSGVRHTLNHHSNVKIEKARGQVALTEQDFGQVPLILSEADAVYARGRTFHNVETIAFTKLINGEGYWLLKEVRPGRKLLALKSMWKKKGPWRDGELPE